MKIKLIQNSILFILTFIIVFIIYEFIFARDYKDQIKLKLNKKNSINKNRKKPVEVRLLESYYKVDISKLSYSALLNRIAVVSSLDISFIVTVACISNRGYIQILIAAVLIVPVIYISYLLLSIVLKKKIERRKKKGNDKNE
ncbi:MAG: hypothetical protein IKO49_03195 [Bacilli bacterium]|nr:hypothetical protein [Bacilli bacterium]